MSKSTLEDIASEFIMWEFTTPWDDELRRDFLLRAFHKHFPHHAPSKLLPQFVKAYEKVYRREQSQVGFDPETTSPRDIGHLLEQKLMAA
jgi:hypothetical protein